MSAPWRLLNRTSPETELPPLLISTRFTSNSYAVNITDLTYIWSESLDRRSIIKRSLDEDTSIDPSEDAEQLRVFLGKIQSALLGAEVTTLSLQAKSSANSDGPASLDLLITVKLPKGLKPLKWPIHLTPSPQSELLSQLTIPILRAQNARMKELDRLLEMLREKDHVIQKLVDTLETIGTELGHVFPGAAGKGGRKIPRKLAEQRVKGLGVFKVEDWKKEMRVKENESSHDDVKSIMKKVFEEDPSSVLDPVTDSEVPRTWLNWWVNLKERAVDLSRAAETQTNNNKTTEVLKVQGKDKSGANEDENDFQIQATPPHLGGGSAEDTDPASSPPTLRSQAVIQDSTDDDDDDLDAPSQRSIVQDSVPLSLPRQQPRKLDALGRSKPIPAPAPPARSKRKSTSPAPHTKSNGNHPVIDDEETASEDESHHSPAKPSPPPSPPKPASAAPSKKAQTGGLGKIGGKAREGTPPPVVTTAAAAAAAEKKTTTPPDHRPKHRLGVIGHKAKAKAAAAAATPAPATDANADDGSQEMRGRGPEVTRKHEEEVAEEPRETSKERADRKREELKRALEEKARAPVKKRRKF